MCLKYSSSERAAELLPGWSLAFSALIEAFLWKSKCGKITDWLQEQQNPLANHLLVLRPVPPSSAGGAESKPVKHRQSSLALADSAVMGGTSWRKDESEGCGGVWSLCSSVPGMQLRWCPGKFHQSGKPAHKRGDVGKPCLRGRRSRVHLPKIHLTVLLYFYTTFVMLNNSVSKGSLSHTLGFLDEVKHL